MKRIGGLDWTLLLKMLSLYNEKIPSMKQPSKLKRMREEKSSVEKKT